MTRFEGIVYLIGGLLVFLFAYFIVQTMTTPGAG